MKIKLKKTKPAIEGAKRVGVFLDLSNISAAATVHYKSRVNYYELLQAIANGRQLISAIAYCVCCDGDETAYFHEQLKHFGYRLRIKKARVMMDGTRKGDWDVGLAVDAIILAPKLDVAVIVSGDRDFIDLIEPLHNFGCSVEVYSFFQNTSADLRYATDRFCDIGDSNRFFLPN